MKRTGRSRGEKDRHGYRAQLMAASALALAPAGAFAQTAPTVDLAGAFHPFALGAIGVLTLAAAGLLAVALRLASASRNQSVLWSQRLAEMEAQLEKAEGVLSAHPGLVLVWEDDYDAIEKGWGEPKILGGPAALASLMSFAKAEDLAGPSPIARLLESLGNLPVEDDGPSDEIKTLRDKVHELRAHGLPFSGSVVTSEGRPIEADGRVAGSQVALWLTDPAVRMAEDAGLIGKVRERTTDLHGALALLDRVPMPAWRRNADLSLAWVNRAYADAVEAASPAAALKDQLELDSGARKIAERAAAERRPVDGRIIVNIRGERRVFRIVETPMHTAGAAALGGVATDITDLDRARSDLKSHIDASRKTLDQIPVAVALFNAAQTLTYHNDAFARLWGLDEAELATQPSHGEILDRLRHAGKLPEPENYADWKSEQLALYAAFEGAADSAEDAWRLPDGRTLRVARARHPLGGIVVVFEDISERLALAARYNTQINVQRATLNNLAEGVAVFGADGAMRLHNAAFQRLFRLDKDLLAERPHIDRVLAALRSNVARGAEALDEVKRRAVSLTPEDRVPLEEASLTLIDGRSFSAATEPLPDGATLMRVLDVTDSREREKELKERNAFLEDIDRQKSKFVDHISYQLRTPLATIIGFAEMLDDQMFGMLNDRQKDYVASILTASNHLRDLITDIIDLAVIDAGKMTLEVSSVDVRELLANAATYAALKAEDAQTKLSVECAKDIGPIVADAKRLKQVLFNLLSNAFAYTAPGGNVVLGADRTPGLVRIFVADTGRGVSPEDQARAFDPFESRGPSAGAGLGLSLVQKFISLHGGWVRMESEPGKGTRVTCYLPERAAPLSAPDQGQDQSCAPKADQPRTAGKGQAAPARRRRAGGPKAQAAE
ncbi:MAG: PAS-domain containing protein [Parvularculaceae bacterium]|nr:PAS-domain containing protein [Parvularculaceae bacterium]